MDSRPETLKHREEVAKWLQLVINQLHVRQETHDQSKLESPEVEYFDKYTEKLKGLTYGSEEYKKSLDALRPAIDHHYEVNPHHPQFYGDYGIRGMSLVDILEMLCDWKAANKRNVDGNILKSLEINQKRFGFSDELRDILLNTIQDLGMDI
jgi:hypothetical protein